MFLGCYTESQAYNLFTALPAGRGFGKSFITQSTLFPRDLSALNIQGPGSFGWAHIDHRIELNPFWG